MSKHEDGGPAFPRTAEDTLRPITDVNNEVVNAGMSLRDFFAGQALVSIGAWTPLAPKAPYYHAPDLKSAAALKARAEWSYAQADAMLKARSANLTSTAKTGEE